MADPLMPANIAMSIMRKKYVYYSKLDNHATDVIFLDFSTAFFVPHDIILD